MILPRHRKFLFAGVTLITTSFLLYSYSKTNHFEEGSVSNDEWFWGAGSLEGPPPTYETFWEAEAKLPQHNVDLPFPEGKTGKYVKFSNAIYGLGWNNQLNEILLNNHLAWAAGYGYVYDPQTWKIEYFPWKMKLWKNRRNYSPETPLTALIAGPTAGGPWEAGDNTPRSINTAHWEKVCPEEDRHIIWSDQAKSYVGNSPGDEVMAHWVKLLKESPKRCVEVKIGPSNGDSFPQVFDLWLIGCDRSIPLWQKVMKDSPVSKGLKTSPLVNFAVQRNEHLFQRGGPNNDVVWNPYERMLAIHIRRGDYDEACVRLAQWRSTFYNWNLLPELPDKFEPPPGGGDGYAPPENIKFYKDRCYPTTEQLLEKIQNVKTMWENHPNGGKLDTLFILTNAKAEFLEDFREQVKVQGWVTVVTSKDLVLDKEQIGVNMAVDMEIARRAAVFIGNGWSSFTSNILHRRIIDGTEWESNRFW